MRKIIFIISIFLFSGILSAQKTLTILHTNNINAQLENCLCDKHPYGGLEKIGYQVKKLREKQAEILLLDAGDFFPAYPDSNKITTLLRIMQYLKYDAMGPGDQEFLLGYKSLKNAKEEYKLPFISSNILVNGKNLFPPSKIFKKGNFLIKIFALISERAFDFYPEEIKNEIEVTDPEKFLSTQLAGPEKKNQITILLSHLGEETDRVIAKKFPELDIIIGGHSQTTLPEPVRIGKTIILQAGGEAYYLGKLDLQMGNKDRYTVKGYQLIKMGLELPNDPAIVNLVKNYDFHFIHNALANMPNSHIIGEKYLVKEAESCAGECHSQQLENWKKGKHSKAWHSLEKENKTKISECVSCHASGYGRKDGFFNINLTPEMTNVTCTECHLTRREHLTLKNSKSVEKINKNNCLRCHDKKNDPEFNYEKKMKELNY